MAASRAGTHIVIPRVIVDTIMRCDIDHIRGIPILGITVIVNIGHTGIARMGIVRMVRATNLIGYGVDSATIVEKPAPSSWPNGPKAAKRAGIRTVCKHPGEEPEPPGVPSAQY